MCAVCGTVWFGFAGVSVHQVAFCCVCVCRRSVVVSELNVWYLSTIHLHHEGLPRYL